MTIDEQWHVGIDVGGTNMRVLGERADGTRTEIAVVATPHRYDEFLEQLETLLASSITGPIGAIGCGICGTSDGSRPIFVPAMPWIENMALRDDLSAIAGAPVNLGMDGHYTLLAEAIEGAALGHDSAVLVAAGTGIGGAIMVSRRIWRGARGSAGSFGWLGAHGAIDDLEHGRFEQVASGTALSRAANAYRAGWTGEELISAARLGDPGATGIAASFGYAFGRGLAVLASVLDPEVLIVGGGLSGAMDVLGPPVKQAMLAVSSPNGRETPVITAGLGSHAGVIGALLASRPDADVFL